MTEIRTEKAVSSVVTQTTFTPALKAEKTVSGVVTQTTFTPALKIEKAVATVVVQVPPPVPPQKLTKTVSSVVVAKDGTGNARQATSGNRPVYKAGPRSYLDFTGGKSLSMFALPTATYQFVNLKPDGQFTETQVNLTGDPSDLPSTNFNQLYFYEVGIKKPQRRYYEMIKANMRKRTT